MTQFALTVTFRLHPGQRDAFLPLMLDNARQSRASEPGCLRFDVLMPDPDDGVTVFLYEVYTDRAAFDAHLAADHYHRFDAATRALVAGKLVQFFALMGAA